MRTPLCVLSGGIFSVLLLVPTLAFAQGSLETTDHPGKRNAMILAPDAQPPAHMLPSDQTSGAAQQSPTRTATGGVITIPVETDAVIYDEFKEDDRLMNWMVQQVLSSGHRCDSVSGARAVLYSHGFELTCNRFHYTYSIKDNDGRWVVTAE